MQDSFTWSCLFSGELLAKNSFPIVVERLSSLHWADLPLTLNCSRTFQFSLVHLNVDCKSIQFTGKEITWLDSDGSWGTVFIWVLSVFSKYTWKKLFEYYMGTMLLFKYLCFVWSHELTFCNVFHIVLLRHFVWHELCLFIFCEFCMCNKGLKKNKKHTVQSLQIPLLTDWQIWLMRLITRLSARLSLCVIWLNDFKKLEKCVPVMHRSVSGDLWTAAIYSWCK